MNTKPDNTTVGLTRFVVGDVGFNGEFVKEFSQSEKEKYYDYAVSLLRKLVKSGKYQWLIDRVEKSTIDRYRISLYVHSRYDKEQPEVWYVDVCANGPDYGRTMLTEHIWNDYMKLWIEKNQYVI